MNGVQSEAVHPFQTIFQRYLISECILTIDVLENRQLLENRDAFSHNITTDVSQFRVTLQDALRSCLLITVDQIFATVAIASSVHIPQSVIISNFFYGLVHNFNIFLLLHALVELVQIAQTHNRKWLRNVLCKLFALVSAKISNSGVFSLETIEQNVSVVMPSYQWFLVLPLFIWPKLLLRMTLETISSYNFFLLITSPLNYSIIFKKCYQETRIFYSLINLPYSSKSPQTPLNYSTLTSNYNKQLLTLARQEQYEPCPLCPSSKVSPKSTICLCPVQLFQFLPLSKITTLTPNQLSVSAITKEESESPMTITLLSVPLMPQFFSQVEIDCLSCCVKRSLLRRIMNLSAYSAEMGGIQV